MQIPRENKLQKNPDMFRENGKHMAGFAIARYINLLLTLTQ